MKRFHIAASSGVSIQIKGYTLYQKNASDFSSILIHCLMTKRNAYLQYTLFSFYKKPSKCPSPRPLTMHLRNFQLSTFNYRKFCELRVKFLINGFLIKRRECNFVSNFSSRCVCGFVFLFVSECLFICVCHCV